MECLKLCSREQRTKTSNELESFYVLPKSLLLCLPNKALDWKSFPGTLWNIYILCGVFFKTLYFLIQIISVYQIHVLILVWKSNNHLVWGFLFFSPNRPGLYFHLGAHEITPIPFPLLFHFISNSKLCSFHCLKWDFLYT